MSINSINFKLDGSQHKPRGDLTLVANAVLKRCKVDHELSKQLR